MAVFNEDNTTEQMILSTLKKMAGSIFRLKNWIVMRAMSWLSLW